ncbi:MAG: amidohydrolase family protein [Planctomycetota bacterium]
MEVFGNLLRCDPDRPGHLRLDRGTIRIRDGYVSEIILGDQPSNFDLGGEDRLICPSFIDTHVHLPQFDMIGAHGLTLLEWLQRHTFPAEVRWNDPAYAELMTHRVMDQCFAHGTTRIAAYATSSHEATKAAINVASQRGMTGVIGQVLMDRGGPDELLHPISRQLDEVADLLGSSVSAARLGTAVTPRFAVSCSEPLLSGAGKLAEEYGAIIQTHLAETIQECDYVGELFGGRNYVRVYADTGLLTHRSIFGHGIHLTDLDRNQLAANKAHVAHCPTANSFLKSGTMNRDAHRSQNVPICLGSDIGAGYERSMVRVGRAMLEAAAVTGGHQPGANHAWWMITHGNLDAFQEPTDERLAVDRPADLLVIRPDVAWAIPGEDIDTTLSRLMFSWDDRWLLTTISEGNITYQRD